jgi:hypothetical protein
VRKDGIRRRDAKGKAIDENSRRILMGRREVKSRHHCKASVLIYITKVARVDQD